MTTFLALYRGNSLSDCEIIAISSDEDIVAEFARRLLDKPHTETDPILHEKKVGIRKALRLVSEPRPRSFKR